MQKQAEKKSAVGVYILVHDYCTIFFNELMRKFNKLYAMRRDNAVE